MESLDILKIKNLKKGECLVADTNIDLCNILQLNEIHIQSYENLYLSYVNKTCDEANNFNITLFLEKYVGLKQEREYIIEEIIRNSIGNEKYDILKQYYFYNYDINFDSHTIIISIEGVKK